MKTFILKLAAKIIYKLADKIQCDFNNNGRNDLLELGDKLTILVESIKK